MKIGHPTTIGATPDTTRTHRLDPGRVLHSRRPQSSPGPVPTGPSHTSIHTNPEINNPGTAANCYADRARLRVGDQRSLVTPGKERIAA